MHFETPPRVSFLTTALRLVSNASGRLPRLEATATRVPFDSEAYAAVCGFPPAAEVPLTYPGVACRGLQLAVMTHAAFPFRLPGLVHVRQRIERARALRAAEVVSARVTVEGVRVVRRGGEFDLVTELLAGGEVVWRGVSSILTREVQGDGVKREPPPEPPRTVEETATWTLAANLGRRYAAVSGDYNPIHLWPLTARLFGFRRPIAHGWWSLARCVAQLGDRVPDACVVEAAFRRPLSLPGPARFEAGRAGASVAFSLSRDEVCLSGTVAARS